MTGSVRALLILVVAGTGAFLALLTLSIAINRALREMGETLDRRRRRLLEPVVSAYLRTAPAGSLGDDLPKPSSRRDHRLVEQILLESAAVARGEMRHRVTAALEEHGSVRDAIRDLRGARWWKRADAAEKLGWMGSRAAVEPLVPLMHDPEPEVRLRAARALGLISGGTSIRPLVSALAGPSRWSAIRVAEILIDVGADAVDQLLAAYDTLPQHARVTALDVLGAIRSPRAAGLMQRCLLDLHPDIRARAAHGLGRIGASGAAPDLIRSLADEEWPVRAMAAKALGRLGGSSAIPSLRRALQDRQWWVRSNAGEALRALGPAGLEALTGMLNADDRYARHMAATQIEEGRRRPRMSRHPESGGRS